VLAELARSERHRFRVLVPDCAPSSSSSGAGRPGSLPRSTARSRSRFRKRYRSPVDARGLGEQRLERFLARRHHRGRRSAREPLARLRAGAEGRAGRLATAARGRIVLALIAALEPLVTRIAELTSEIGAALADHVDRPTFRSLLIDPRSAITAATMLSEIGDCRDR